jgi:hypothetical protein
LDDLEFNPTAPEILAVTTRTGHSCPGGYVSNKTLVTTYRNYGKKDDAFTAVCKLVRVGATDSFTVNVLGCKGIGTLTNGVVKRCSDCAVLSTTGFK